MLRAFENYQQLAHRHAPSFIRDVLETFSRGTLKAAQAAEQLGLSRSRLYALSSAYLRARARKQGSLWIPGRSGGDHATPWPQPVLDLLDKRLNCSPPCPYSFVASEARRLHGFPLDRAQVRRWALENNLAHAVPPKKVRAAVRRWQRHRIGELWQLDASPYRWFPHCKIAFPMLNMLDDCSRLFTGSKLYERELLLSYFDFLPAAFLAHGRPLQLYVDYHSLFFTHDPDALTQLGWALVRLGRRWHWAVEVRSCAAKSRAVSNRNCVVATRGGEHRNENDQSVTQATRMGRRRELDSVGVAGRAFERMAKPVERAISVKPNRRTAGRIPDNTPMVGDGMDGSSNEETRETRRCWWAKRDHSPRAWPAGVRASVVAMKRVTTVERRERRKVEVRRTERRKRKPTRVPARASQWWNQPSAIGLGDIEGLPDGLGDEAKSRSLSHERPPTGKPDAGEPPVRFGGRGSGRVRSPYPYQFYDISLRYAPTPQAKGKVEREHQFWQGRLPPYFGSEKITALEEANQHLDALRAHRNTHEVHRELRQTPPRAWNQAKKENRSVVRPVPHCPWWPYVWSVRTPLKVGTDGRVPIGTQRLRIEKPPGTKVVLCLHPDGHHSVLAARPEVREKPALLFTNRPN